MIGERTTKLRLGHRRLRCFANLDALRIAEDYATLDVLSDGRVDIVSGRGNFFESTYALFGQSVERGVSDRFAENAELLEEPGPVSLVTTSGKFRLVRSTARRCNRHRASRR